MNLMAPSRDALAVIDELNVSTEDLCYIDRSDYSLLELLFLRSLYSIYGQSL